MCIISWDRSPVQERRSYGAATGTGAAGMAKKGRTPAKRSARKKKRY